MAAKFKFVTEHLYWWPVNVRMPDPNRSGQWMTMAFEVQFEAVSETETRAEAARIAALPTQEQRAACQHDLLVRKVRDWRQVVDEENQPIAFSEELLRQAIDRPWFRDGLYDAFRRSMPEARLGN